MRMKVVVFLPCLLGFAGCAGSEAKPSKPVASATATTEASPTLRSKEITRPTSSSREHPKGTYIATRCPPETQKRFGRKNEVGKYGVAEWTTWCQQSDGTLHGPATAVADLPGTYEQTIHGAFFSGSRHGPWKIIYSDGSVETGSFVDGLREGTWSTRYRSGKLKTEGTYLGGSQQGTWIEWHRPGGKASEGKYVSGIEDGLWTSWFENGQRAHQRSYLAGRRNGLSTKWSSGGSKKEEGSFLMGARHGTWTLHATRRESGRFHCGQAEGRWKSWHNSGQPAWECDFVEGRPLGDFVSWHENGKVALRGSYGKPSSSGVWVPARLSLCMSDEGRVIWRRSSGKPSTTECQAAAEPVCEGVFRDSFGRQTRCEAAAVGMQAHTTKAIDRPGDIGQVAILRKAFTTTSSGILVDREFVASLSTTIRRKELIAVAGKLVPRKSGELFAYALRPNSILVMMGLMNGDVLLRVNGAAIKGISNRRRALAKVVLGQFSRALITSEKSSIEILRNGSTQVIEYSLAAQQN